MSSETNLAGLGHLVNGQIVRTGRTFPVTNPATGEVVAQCPEADTDLLDQAVAAAQAALPGWAATSEASRRETIRAMGNVLKAHMADLTEVAKLEHGGTTIFGEVYMAGVYADHLADTPLPVDVLEDTDERLVRLVRKPVGVVAAISPWNAPLLISAEKVFAALHVGNTVVLKPSPFTPLGTLKMGELWKDIVPPGVVNIIAGGDEIGAAMVEHPGTRLVSLTGSVAAGRKVAEAAGRQLKRVVCELGGNDAAIVLPDVDPRTVAPLLFRGAFTLSGQACAAIKRLYVHESIHAEVVEALADLARQTTAAPDGSGGDFGPLVTGPQFDRVSTLVSDALDHGAKAVTGGGPTGEGNYFPATILTDVGSGVRIVDEEQFGPALPVIPYSDIDEIIDEANNTEYGLGGSIWTADIERGQELAGRLASGTVWVNHHTEVAPSVPFGGVKSSGIGRSGGKEGIDNYADVQTQIVYKLRDRVTPSAG